METVLDKYAIYALAIMILCYTVTLSCFTVQRHRTYASSAFDLGIYSQALWSTLHGKLLYETPDLFLSESFFGVHFSPILLFLVPLYAFYPSPEVLLVLQSLILALAALPLYKLACNVLHNKRLSLAVATLYLLYPPLHASNFYDFHIHSFLPLFFIASAYYLLQKRWLKGAVFIILSLLTIEVAAVFTAAIGLYLLVRFRRENAICLIVPIVILLGSAIVFRFSLEVISSFNKKAPFIEGGIDWFPHLGKSPGEILVNVFSLHVIEAISYNWWAKLVYWLMLLFPLRFTPLLSPTELILLLPWFIITLLTDHASFYTVGWQYNVFITPFLFISLIYVLNKFSQRRRTLLIELVILTSTSLALYSPLSLVARRITPLLQLTGAAYAPFGSNAHVDALNKILLLVPSNASILTQNNIFPHIANNLETYIWLPGSVVPEYILVDFKSNEFRTQVWNTTTEELFYKLVTKYDYGLVATADGVWLMKLGYKGKTIIEEPFTEPLKFVFRDLTPYSGTYTLDLSSENLIVLTHVASDLGNTTFWAGPYFTLPPGKYVAVFKLKVDNIKPSIKLMTTDVVTDYGETVLTRRVIYGEDFRKPNEWHYFELEFSLKDITRLLEFRCVDVNSSVSAHLDSIDVIQVELP
jgi:uncharacterized membrane protein